MGLLWWRRKKNPEKDRKRRAEPVDQIVKSNLQKEEQPTFTGQPAVVEFGGAKREPKMRGICQIHDPHDIQACVWTIEDSDDKSRAKYKIEF